MHRVLALILLPLLVGTVSSAPCSKSCTLPLVLYESTCVCLPTYVKQSCIKGDKDRCSRVINAGLCGTVTYAAACASGCGLCNADYVKPTGPQVFFGPDKSARDLFDVDCGSPPGLGDGTVAPTSTTFTSIARYTCNPGYLMAGHGLSKCQHDGSWSSLATVCNDIDECDTNADNCHAAATCTNNPGSFSCACNAGYSGNGVICADINECSTGAHNCHVSDASCSNTPGGFTCACNPGYSGDGVSCTDINECTTDTHDCHVTDATCTNTPGSFTCACNPGYTGDGVNCTVAGVDECANGNYSCPAGSQCVDTPRAYKCGNWAIQVLAASGSKPGFSLGKILGVPKVYPAYGEIAGAWETNGVPREQFILVRFGAKHVMTGVDIYETYNSGHVTEISTGVSGNWISVEFINCYRAGSSTDILANIPDRGALSDEYASDYYPSQCNCGYRRGQSILVNRYINVLMNGIKR